MSRGQGRLFRPKVKGQESAVWWLDYTTGGQRHRESSGTKSKQEAQRLLRQKFVDREAGKVVGRPDRVTLHQLRELAERQYDLDGRRSAIRLKSAFNHLETRFGAETRAPALTAARCDAYASTRLTEGAARATVNYELAALRRGMRLAVEKGLLGAIPVIKLPRVRNARSGFFEDGEFAALLLELSPALRPLIRFLRFTGWRRGEGLGLTWDQVDWEGATIRLSGGQTKSGEPRVFPFGTSPELKGLLETQWKDRNGIFVFHIGGQPIAVGRLRSGWRRATRRAGLEGRLVHDLRRSAARDMRRAGLAESDIMALCGWETREMFKRYCIRDEGALAQAVAKLSNGKVTAKNPPAPTGAQSLS